MTAAESTMPCSHYSRIKALASMALANMCMYAQQGCRNKHNMAFIACHAFITTATFLAHALQHTDRQLCLMHLLQASGMLCACRHNCDLTWLCIIPEFVRLRHQGFAMGCGCDSQQRMSHSQRAHRNH